MCFLIPTSFGTNNGSGHVGLKPGCETFRPLSIVVIQQVSRPHACCCRDGRPTGHACADLNLGPLLGKTSSHARGSRVCRNSRSQSWLSGRFIPGPIPSRQGHHQFSANCKDILSYSRVIWVGFFAYRRRKPFYQRQATLHVPTSPSEPAR